LEGALRTGSIAARAARSSFVGEAARFALMPARGYIEEHFESPKVRALMAFFAMQTKTDLDRPGSVLGLWELPWSHTTGVHRPRGGMGAVSAAIARAFEAHGGRIVLDAHVEEILVRDGRATAVRTSGGEIVHARRAIVAAISP